MMTSSADPAEALAAADAHGSAWVGLVDDGVFLGWVTVDTITPDARLRDLERFLPAAQVQLTSTLLSALEVIMNSRTSVAVVQDDGRFKGVVTLERIRAGLAAHGDPEHGERAA
jgi:CBS domain containing-hemolysin-like protein